MRYTLNPIKQPLKYRPMKKFLLSLAFISASLLSFAQDVTINKEKCTITKNGKEYNLHGNVRIVDYGEDFRIRLVDCCEDFSIRLRDYEPSDCLEFRVVDYECGLRVRIVDCGEDFRVRIVDWSPEFRE